MQSPSLIPLVALLIVGEAGLGVLRVPRLRAHAQAGSLAFEAASVRANTSGMPNGQARVSPGGRYTVTNLSLEVLVRFAYEKSPRSRGLEPFEVTGGPDWMDSDRFDVNATAGREVSLTELRLMLQNLLVERFKLKARYEMRQGRVYHLVAARRNRPGPQLRRAEAECASGPADPLRGITPEVSEPCGYFGPAAKVPLNSDKAYQAFRGLTMEDLALHLYPYLGRRVLDRTGFSGYYDGEFEFTAEIVMPPPPPDFPNPYDGRVLPSIFSVLPQQLGLRLQSERGPVEMLVVDHAERPTEN